MLHNSALVVASFYGALSDRKGRRLIFKIAALGNILLMIGYIATIKYQSLFGISLLFIAPVVRGLMAGDTVFFAATQAYISDCTTPTERYKVLYIYIYKSCS
jgi:MFS family permease